MDAQEEKYIKMTTPPVETLICRLAAPCIVSMLVTAFYNMADTYFVGMLKSNAATGAVGVVFSVMAVIQAIGFFFGQGTGHRLGYLHFGSDFLGASGGIPWLHAHHSAPHHRLSAGDSVWSALDVRLLCAE